MTNRQILSIKQHAAKKNVKKYIIDCIDSEVYDVITTTDQEKLTFLHDAFLREAGWNVERVGESKAFTEWISGLPSIFEIEFEDYKILELAKKLGGLVENPTEKQEDRILENYWNYITVNTFQLFNKYKII